MRRILLATMAAIGLTTAAAQAQTRTRLTVYTALENEQLAPFKAAAERAVPGIEIAWVRDSTGVITARLIAERLAPGGRLLIVEPGTRVHGRALMAVRDGRVAP